MDSQRTEYPTLLASVQPEQAITLLQDRVSLIAKINNDIADWLQERRKVEEAYVAGLRKLARRPQQDGAAALGVFQTSWQRIVSGTENLAASHETLANKLETDVEAPLRSFANRNRDSQALSSTQGNLAMLAKDITNAQRKAAKGGRNAASANSAVEDTTRQWEAQAPYVFEQLQALDETRVNHLRDVLTQFQTHELDSIEKSRASAESILNALLSVETADEIKLFAERAATQRPSLTTRRSSTTPSTRPASSSLRPPPTPPPPRHTDDRRSQRSISTAGQDRLTPLPEPTPQKEKSKLGGLKRLGTVMSRRKSTVPPVPHHTSNEEKRKTRSFVPFRRGDSSRSFQDLEASGPDLTPSASQDYPVPPPERSYEPPTQVPSEEPVPVVLTNGTTTSQPAHEPHVEAPASQQSPPESQLPPPELAAQEPPPPATPAKDPIAQAQRDAAAAALTGDESSRNFQIRDQPIQEDESEAQLALSSIANQLRTQAQSSGINRVQGSMRGRRDVRNTMFIPNDALDSIPALPQAGSSLATSIPAASASNENILASPIQRPPIAPALHEDHGVGSDTTSIYSSRSLGGPTNHADLHDSGLNASILETVHSWFTDSGVSKAFVLGEVAFAYNPTGATDAEHETIRLQHFELLDKVAANPIYLTQTKSSGPALTEEHAGTYTVATSPIRRPSPLVGLKYQLHLEDTNMAQYSPVLVTPAWQIVEGQVSVIVLYSLNPLFGSDPVSLKNVVISVNLDTSGEGTGKAVSAMMSPTPGASFKRKTSAVVWKLNDFTVKPVQERLLVRFVTQGGLAKKGTVELKFEVPGRVASAIGVEKVSPPSDKEKEVDPFADDGGEGSSARGSADEKRWELLPARKRLVTGRYTAT